MAIALQTPHTTHTLATSFFATPPSCDALPKQTQTRHQNDPGPPSLAQETIKPPKSNATTRMVCADPNLTLKEVGTLAHAFVNTSAA